ncbi:hypothetical protein HanRHA438_Chr15g0710651 [Helianthus annuus]|nr:hypothetical protein HanRHA438_Chr15g0710651 [Helianthus annuus]
MDANGTKPLLSNFTYDDDVTVRTKALGAIFKEGLNNKKASLDHNLELRLGGSSASNRPKNIEFGNTRQVKFSRQSNSIHFRLDKKSVCGSRGPNPLINPPLCMDYRGGVKSERIKNNRMDKTNHGLAK